MSDRIITSRLLDAVAPRSQVSIPPDKPRREVHGGEQVQGVEESGQVHQDAVVIPEEHAVGDEQGHTHHEPDYVSQMKEDLKAKLHEVIEGIKRGRLQKYVMSCVATIVIDDQTHNIKVELMDEYTASNSDEGTSHGPKHDSHGGSKKLLTKEVIEEKKQNKKKETDGSKPSTPTGQKS